MARGSGEQSHSTGGYGSVSQRPADVCDSEVVIVTRARCWYNGRMSTNGPRHSSKRVNHSKRRSHPVVLALRDIRERHDRTSSDVEGCMGIPIQTLKQIEEGYRPLPGLQEDPGAAISIWIQKWFDCVGVTDDERTRVEDLLETAVLGRLRREGLKDPPRLPPSPDGGEGA